MKRFYLKMAEQMVKNPSESGPGDQAANKLARLKQTLTNGLQQATESGSFLKKIQPVAVHCLVDFGV